MAEASSIDTEIQQDFVEALSRIERVARFRLRHLDAEAKEDAVAEVIALSWKAYRHLFLQGRNVAPLVGKIAEFACRRVRSGRLFVGSRIRDVLSSVPRHEALAHDAGDLIDAVRDRKHSSPADEAVLKVDIEEWMEGLEDKRRRVATDLAGGLNTTDVARKHGVTRTRIWQLREELKASWDQFHS